MITIDGFAEVVVLERDDANHTIKVRIPNIDSPCEVKEVWLYAKDFRSSGFIHDYYDGWFDDLCVNPSSPVGFEGYLFLDHRSAGRKKSLDAFTYRSLFADLDTIQCHLRRKHYPNKCMDCGQESTFLLEVRDVEEYGMCVKNVEGVQCQGACKAMRYAAGFYVKDRQTALYYHNKAKEQGA